jgi:hypothetical protein
LRFFGGSLGVSWLVSRVSGCLVFKSKREGLGDMLKFLAGERKVFEMLVNSIGENLIFDGLMTCFFPWALLFETKEGPTVNWFSSIEIEPGYKLDGFSGMEQVSNKVVSGVRCPVACPCDEEVACLEVCSLNVIGVDLKVWFVRKKKVLSFLSAVKGMREKGADMVISVFAAERVLSKVAAGVMER